MVNESRAPSADGSRTPRTPRPRRWAALTAVLAVATGFTGLAGVGVMTDEPEHSVVFEVEDGLPYGITQERVDAAARQRDVRSWEPLTVGVTADHLLPPRLYGATDPSADALLSTQLERLPLSASSAGLDVRRTQSGATVDPAVFPAQREGIDARPGAAPEWMPAASIGAVFQGDLGLGHGATAVAAAAETAGELTYNGLPRDPLLWAAVVGPLALLGLVCAVLWARSVRALAQLRRRFRTARSEMAGVVLDLEAVEASTQAIAEDRRGPQDERAWLQLREGALALLQDDAEIVADVRRPRRDTAARVAAYADEAALLSAQSRALESTAQVRAGLAGAGSVLDRVAAVLVEPARQAVATVRGLPATPPAVRQAAAGLDDAVDTLLARLERARRAPADVRPGAWTTDETALGRAAARLTDTLEAARGVSDLRAGWTALPARRLQPEYAEIRRGLRLASTGERIARDRVDEALAAAHVAAGQPPEDALAAARAARLTSGDGGPEEGAAAHVGRGAVTGGAVTGGAVSGDAMAGGSGWGPTMLLGTADRAGHWRLRWPVRVAAGVLALAVSFLGATAAVDSLFARPTYERTGEASVGEVTVQGLPLAGRPDLELSGDEIADRVDDTLLRSVDVQVAVRRAEDYFTRTYDEGSGASVRTVDPVRAVEGMHRLKAEFPEHVDPATGDLRPGTVIVPVMVWSDGRGGAVDPLTGDAATGTRGRFGASQLDRGTTGAADLARQPGYLAVDVAHTVEDLSFEQQSDADYGVDADPDVLVGLLTAGGTLGLVLLGALAEVLAGVTSGRRGRGRTAQALRETRARLERLMLGRDESALSAVAVLGGVPAGSPREAEHRLYDAAVLDAWRELERLEGQPWSARLAHRTRGQAGSLARRVADLERQDVDVRTRAEAYLAATR